MGEWTDRRVDGWVEGYNGSIDIGNYPIAYFVCIAQQNNDYSFWQKVRPEFHPHQVYLFGNWYEQQHSCNFILATAWLCSRWKWTHLSPCR